jgi:colanic acid/amylovoran biosynthesis protein
MNRIILTNQHSDNRGDEAATIGSVKSLRRYFGGDAQITMYLQSGTRHKFLPDVYNVMEKPMLIGAWSTLELLIWIVFKAIEIDVRGVCSQRLREFLSAHEQAAVVISSCAGPYIGDIYINHEFLHIAHMAVPILLGKKTAFYAPSMGPFRNKFMNVFRKMMLDRVGVIILRDAPSFDYVKEFLPEHKHVYLTTDSCLADELEPGDGILRTDFIGVTLLDYKYPLAADRRARKERYEQAVVRALNALMEENPHLMVEFFPQLYARHTDLPFIRRIIAKLKNPERTIIFPDGESGREQQREIARLEYMIATRHHAAVFACKVHTPVVCIVYEYKAAAFMKSLGLEEYCVDIYQISADVLLQKIRELKRNSGKIKAEMPAKIRQLSELANTTARLLHEYVTGNLEARE